MITREEMMKPLLEACPSFKGAYNKFISYWSNEPEELPEYIALSELVSHVIHLYEEKDFKTIGKVFKVVERWHLEGDTYVREAATIGFLEDLQNENFHTKTEPKDFERFLLPDSKRFWKELQVFWSKGTLITDD